MPELDRTKEPRSQHGPLGPKGKILVEIIIMDKMSHFAEVLTLKLSFHLSTHQNPIPSPSCSFSITQERKATQNPSTTLKLSNLE